MMYKYDVEKLRQALGLFILNQNLSVNEFSRQAGLDNLLIKRFLDGHGLGVEKAFIIMNFIMYEPE